MWHTSEAWRLAGRPVGLCLLGATLLVRPGLAQQAGENQNPAQRARAGGFTAAVEMVRVPVVVEDNGNFVRDLGKSNFVVMDGGVSHMVDHFVPDAELTSVGIVVDASATMASDADQVRQAIMQAANNLRPGDELFLIIYGATAAILSPPSSDRSTFAMTLVKYQPAGTDRALYDAVELGLQTLAASIHDKRTLILVGAGGDTSSEVGELTLQQDINRAGVTIHAIALAARPTRTAVSSSRVNRVQTLPEIARFTGGMVAQRPLDAARFGGFTSWLETAAADISTYVKHQYLLHYTPANPPRPGTWRAIRVRVNVDYEFVRARSGYIR